MTSETRGRGLFVGSLVVSAVGVALLAWWLLSDPRAWWRLVAGAVAAIIGVAIAARARREPGETEGER